MIVIITCTFAIALIWKLSALHCEKVQPFTNSNVVFLSVKDVQEFLNRDEDGYIASLTPIDLVARNVATSQEYKTRVAALAVEPTATQKDRVRDIAAIVDQHLVQSNKIKMSTVPWKLAFLKDNLYENGYPHTRGDIIFLSIDELESHDLASTLLHEKVHVYQRMYPEDMSKYLAENGYKVWKLRADEPMARANPDLDSWIYIDPRNNKPMVALYTSSNPSSISDVILQNAAYEHPYEKMAYEIAASRKTT